MGKTPRTDPMTIYQSVGREPDPNYQVFSCGPHSRRVSASGAGFHLGGKLLGRSFLPPPLAMVRAQDDGAVEQGEADPRSVGREQGQDRPQEHVLEQVVERAEQQAPQVPKMVFVWPLKARVARIGMTDFVAGWFRCQRNKIGDHRPSGKFLCRLGRPQG